MYETAEIGTLYQTSAVIFLLSNQTFTTSSSKSVTVYTLWTEGPLLFLDQTETKFFWDCPFFSQGLDDAPPPLLSEGLDSPLPTSNFLWEPHPENLNWHVVCLLTSFQGETSTFTWLFIAVEQTGLRLFAIPNQCATPVHECWLRTAFIESPTAQAVIREEPFDYEVFVEMRICWRSPKRQWTDWGTEQDLKA